MSLNLSRATSFKNIGILVWRYNKVVIYGKYSQVISTKNNTK